MKRFTATEKWDDPWFWELTPAAKLLWLFLCDHCDGAGIIELNLRFASMKIGLPVDKTHLAELKSRLHPLPCGKMLIIGFIRFQFGALSRDCKPHNPIFASLARHNLDLPQVESLGKGLPKGIHTQQEKEKEPEREPEKEKEQEKEAGIASSMQQACLEIYENYPRKVAKKEALKSIEKAIAKHDPAKVLQQTIAYAKARTGQDEQYTPHPTTWFNQERFNDDPTTWITSRPSFKDSRISPQPIKPVAGSTPVNGF